MLSINTNLSSLIAQSSLKNSTNILNQAVERMTTGYKINHAKDNAANYSIATNMTTQLNAYDVAADNVAMGMDLVTTAMDLVSMMQDRASRLQALSTQARNGTYGAQSLSAINAEAGALINEITRLYSTSEYNGVSLFNRQEYTIAPHLPRAGDSGFIDESSFSGTDPPPTAKAEYGGFIANPKTYEDIYVDGLTSVSAAINGAGLEANKEYKVDSKEDLVALANFVNNGNDTTNMTFILAKDIDLSSISNWTPIGDYSTNTSYAFIGTFDGNGHKIKNLKINNPDEDYQGLFGFAASAQIKNVGLVGGSIKAHDNVGGLVGYSNSSIVNCYSEVSIDARWKVGGLVGDSYDSIEKCYTTGSITASNTTVGGLVGIAREQDNIVDSFTVGAVRGTSYVGGLIGSVTSSLAIITNCYATGDVTGTGNSVGGLVGSSSAEVLNSYATGNVNGVSSVGGLVGYINSSSAPITNCYATGNVTGIGDYIGGLIGGKDFYDINLLNCYTTGNVKGNDYVGGLVGIAYQACITNSYAKGDIKGNDYVGGIVGKFEYDSPIMKTYYEGNIIANNYVGGICGYAYDFDIGDSYAKGDVKGNISVGGICGYACWGNMANVYSESTISGNNSVGGLVGEINSEYDGVYISSFSYSQVNGTDIESTGSLIGQAKLTDEPYSELSIGNCKTIAQNINAIGCVYKNATLLADYERSQYETGVSTIALQSTITTLQVGTNSDSTCQMDFDTNFQFDLSGTNGGIETESAFNAINNFLSLLSEKSTQLGAIQNRLESALDSIEVNINNLTSSRSTIRDADLADESASYIQQQILQQAAATLLSTANQSPAIALQLI